MSSDSITPADPSNISQEEIPTLVYETLCEEFGNDQDRRHRGCFISQSLRELMTFISPEQVITLNTTRNMTDNSSTIPIPGSFKGFTTVKTEVKTTVGQRYDKKSHLRFPWGDIRDWLDDNPDLHDVAISSVVIRLDESELLREHLMRLLKAAIGFTDAGAFTEPLYAVMSSTSTAHEPAIRRAVTKYHHPRYFTNDAVDGKRGLGWKKRTLDLDAVWSERAFMKKDGTPFYNMTMRDIEDQAINHTGQTDREYGEINSPLVINKWRKEFSRGTTDTKPYKWTEHGEWVRIGDDKGDDE